MADYNKLKSCTGPRKPVGQIFILLIILGLFLSIIPDISKNQVSTNRGLP